MYKEEPVVKENTVSEEEEEEVDQKPIILENGQAVMPSKKLKKKPLVSNVSVKQEKCSKSVPQIVDSQSNGYILVTVSTICMPILHLVGFS